MDLRGAVDLFVCTIRNGGARVCVRVKLQCGLKWELSGERVVRVRRELSVCGFNVKD